MFSKKPKLPQLGSTTKLLSFDLETNGLHGEAFAIGAVLMDSNGKILDEFTARTNINGPVDEWVEKNVLPAMNDMIVTHKSAHDLREAFWGWYLKAEPECDYVIVSNGYPVEYRFLMKCQEENLEERYWQHPFPILDLATLLITAGEEPSAKSQLLQKIVAENKYSRHHPLHDAKITALAAFRTFKKLDRI